MDENGLVSVKGVARMLSCSERHVWTLHLSGRLPKAVRLGRSVRWDRALLLAWIGAGCPAREKMEEVKG